MITPEQPSNSPNGQYLMFVALLVTGSWCVGLVLNQFRDHPLPLIYETKAERLENSVRSLAVDSLPAPITAQLLPSNLSLEGFKDFAEEGKGLVLDARPEIFHRFGHVPGALSLPREDFEAAYMRMKDRLEVKRDQPLAVYCSGVSCEDAQMVQAALQKLGYTNVAVFHGGWDEWTGAHFPEEKVP